MKKIFIQILSAGIMFSAIVGCGSGSVSTTSMADFIVSYQDLDTNEIQSFAYMNGNYESLSPTLGDRTFLKYGHTSTGLGVFLAHGFLDQGESENGLMYSTNGTIWSKSTNPCPNSKDYSFVAKFIPGNHLIGYCYDNTQDAPLVKGLYSSKDGQNWSELWQDNQGKILYNLNYLDGELFTISCENSNCTEQKPYVLNNGVWNELTIYSRAWELPNNTPINVLGVVSDGKSTLLVQNINDDLFKSIDGGFTWEQVSIPGFDGKEISDLDYKDSTKLFYVSHAGGSGSFMATSLDASKWNTYSIDYPFITSELTFSQNLGYLAAAMDVFDIQQSPLSDLGAFTPLAKQAPVNQEFYFAQSMAGSY